MKRHTTVTQHTRRTGNPTGRVAPRPTVDPDKPFFGDETLPLEARKRAARRYLDKHDTEPDSALLAIVCAGALVIGLAIAGYLLWCIVQSLGGAA